MCKGHALIIDDNLNNISVLEQLLMIEGMTATTCSQTSNLSEKLDSLSAVKVVFLDLEIPKVNGYQALPIIKAHPKFKNVPVVAYSVHVSEISEIMKLGFDGFLGKPLNAEMFPEQLASILCHEPVWYRP